MLTIEEAQRRLSDVPRVDEAVEHLVRDGIANRVGELIGASRAPVRTDQLMVWSGPTGP
jgi:hypothetical protein